MKKKLLSAILVTTMLFLSACNSAATSTTKGSEEPGKSTAATTTAANETTKSSESGSGAAPDSSGKYTYTVYAGTEYETTLLLNFDIDKYLITKNRKVPFFSKGYLMEDLGWNNNGDPNDGFNSRTYYCAYFYDNNTQMIWICGDNYKDSNNATSYPQMGSFTYHLAPMSDFDADARTKEEIQSSEKNYGIYVTFGQHSDALCYTTVNNGDEVGISRDDAIIIAYVLSSAISKPGENPFYGTNLENTKTSVADRYIMYTLP